MENQRKVDSRIDKWTKEEKFLLYEGIKKYGSTQLSKLSESIRGKTEEEIKAALQFYREDPPSTSSSTTAQKRRKITKPSVIPLAGWANFMVESHGYEDLQNEIATALRLISLFEIRPPTESTNNIDFQKAYLMLSEAVQGKFLEDDPIIMQLFNDALTETAVKTKTFLKCPKFKDILKLINVSEPEMSSFIKPTENMELAALRHLLTQKNYNPLFLTEDSLSLTEP